MKNRTAVAVVVLSVLALTAPAAATPIAGENGRIVLTSYQNHGVSRAELFLLPVPFSSGGGTLSAPIATSATERHRHPTWSPDRTKIAYARGPSAGPFDIFVQDLTQPLSATNPVDITSNNAASSEDRPAWSPDGTHIAFERDDGVPANRDIVVSLPNGGLQTNITNTAAAIEGKPAWNPTSSTIYYEKGNAQTGTDPVDIVRRPISFPGGVPTAGAETLAVADVGGEPEIQPAISPDGSKICYGTGYPAAPGTDDIKVAALTGSPAAGSQVSLNATAYYCTWSPDSTMVAYTAGAGNLGDLVMVRADGSSLFEIPLATGTDIQTNPDWAPDGRPECPNSTATVTSGQAVTIPVNCTDTGPQYERSDVKEFISAQPQNGTATQDLAGDPISYKPNANFIGTDFIEIGSFDDFGFGSDKGTIAISVTAPPNNNGGGGGPTTDTVAATISSVLVSPSRWRLGSLLPRFSLAPKGTTIRFSLDENATVTLTFAKAASGRRVGRTCRKTTRANRSRPRCTRYVTKGSLKRSLNAGQRRLRFQGKLSATKRLTLGRHRVTISAVDGAGNKSKTRTAFFTIVRR